MEPEELLDCEMCQYRARILKHLGQAQPFTTEAQLEAIWAYGPRGEIPQRLNDARQLLGAIHSDILRQMMVCEGDQTIAMPLTSSPA